MLKVEVGWHVSCVADNAAKQKGVCQYPVRIVIHLPPEHLTGDKVTVIHHF